MQYIKILIILFLLTNNVLSKTNYFEKAKKLFNNKDYEKSKFLFEKDIVFNPKNFESYFYLAKIHKINKNFLEEEKNLKTVILLNPKLSEAYYLLTLKQIRDGDFNLAKKNAVLFKKFCSSKCKNLKKIENLIKESKG